MSLSTYPSPKKLSLPNHCLSLSHMSYVPLLLLVESSAYGLLIWVILQLVHSAKRGCPIAQHLWDRCVPREHRCFLDSIYVCPNSFVLFIVFIYESFTVSSLHLSARLLYLIYHLLLARTICCMVEPSDAWSNNLLHSQTICYRLKVVCCTLDFWLFSVPICSVSDISYSCNLSVALHYTSAAIFMHLLTLSHICCHLYTSAVINTSHLTSDFSIFQEKRETK